MRILIHNRDLKTLFGGVSCAAAMGLLAGAALYPDLNEGAIKGPQILMSGGGARGDQIMASASVADYRGRVPDYVIGTDALRPRPETEVLAYEDRAEPEPSPERSEVMAYEAPPEIAPVRWQDEPREPSRYPSQHGAVVHEIDLPAPPAPPAAADEEPAAG